MNELDPRETAALAHLGQRFRERLGDLAGNYSIEQITYSNRFPFMVIHRHGATREARCSCSMLRPGGRFPAAQNEAFVEFFQLQLPFTYPRVKHHHGEGREPAVDALMEWVRYQESMAEGLKASAPPIGKETIAEWRALGSARREAAERFETMVVLEEPLEDETPQPVEWTNELRRRIAIHFPRENKGRLELKTSVLLSPRDLQIARFEPHVRSLWYTASGPERRRDPQIIRVRWQWMITQNLSHNWNNTPWIWHPDNAGMALHNSRLDNLPWEKLGMENRDDNIAALTDDPSLPGRIARTILLQDAGRLDEALAEWNLSISEDILELLAGYGDADTSVAFRKAFQKMALWRIPELVAEERKRLDEWRAAKKGRPKKDVGLPLFMLPHETGASRARLFLGEGEDSTGRFWIGSTANEARLPRILWERPVEIDLKRFGFWEE